MPIGKIDSVRTVNGQIITEQTQYHDDYKEACFISWYNAGRPRGRHMRACMAPDEYGRTPNEQILWKWSRELGWNERADAMDKKAMKIVERRSIEKRAAMFEFYAQVGEQMAMKGMEFLEKEHAVDKASDAIKLIIEGYKLEKENTGSAEYAEAVAKMTDEQLKKRAEELMQRLTPGAEVVEGEYTEVE